MQAIITIINVAIVGMFTFYLVGAFVTDKPLGRLIRIIIAPIAAVLYFVLMSWANYDAPFWLATIIFLGPIGSIILLWITGYVLNGKNNKSA